MDGGGSKKIFLKKLDSLLGLCENNPILKPRDDFNLTKKGGMNKTIVGNHQ